MNGGGGLFCRRLKQLHTVSENKIELVYEKQIYILVRIWFFAPGRRFLVHAEYCFRVIWRETGAQECVPATLVAIPARLPTDDNTKYLTKHLQRSLLLPSNAAYLRGVFLLRVDDGQLVVPGSGFQLACAVNSLCCFANGVAKRHFPGLRKRVFWERYWTHTTMAHARARWAEHSTNLFACILPWLASPARDIIMQIRTGKGHTAI